MQGGNALHYTPQAQPGGVVEQDRGIGAGEPQMHAAAEIAVHCPALPRGQLVQSRAPALLRRFDPTWQVIFGVEVD
jgi:hypothetical protein